MNHKTLLIEMINTLAYSWGSDTPPEVYWGFTNLIQFLNAEYNVQIPPLISEEPEAIQILIADIERLL